jgi:hypothetical protein
MAWHGIGGVSTEYFQVTASRYGDYMELHYLGS